MTSLARLIVATTALASLLATGCAGYAGAVAEVRSSLLAGNKTRALEMTNKALDVDEDDELPKKLKGDKALLLLERATVKQGLERFEASRKDFSVSDKHLELLDLKNDTMGNIGKYLFSDDSTVYKAPAYEKLLLNTLNMLNYLAVGDTEGARVEARRLKVMQDYLADEGSEQDSVLGLGSYLAGFTFEMSGKPEQALRHYDEALGNSPYPSLAAPIRRLANCNSYRTERLEQIIGPPPDPHPEPTPNPGEGEEVEEASKTPEPPAPPTCHPKPPGKGTILVVSGVGLAPHKVARRIPIGAAIVIAGALLGAMQTAQAQRFAAKGLLTWINFPTMERSKQIFTHTNAFVDGSRVASEVGLDVSSQVIRAWDSIKGKLMVAAITRMITRLVAGTATEQAIKAAGGDGIGALFAGLAVQGALTAADTPDTRSWVTLPNKIFVARAEVPPGTYEVAVRFEGSRGPAVEKRKVTVVEGGYAVVPIASMR